MKNSAIPASIEVAPKHVLETPHIIDLIPPSTRVYITDIGIHTPAEMAASCKALAEGGLVAVPHLAARRIVNNTDLKDRVARYTDAGVRDVLVIGGGPDRVAGEIVSTMQVLESGILDAHGITHIGVAGHPEGSPDFSDDVAFEALRLKKAFAERTDAKMRIVTQFGFDAEKFIGWADAIANEGIDLPVHLGVAGPAKIMTLLKYAAMCGVGNSIGFLKKHAGSVTALASSYSPENIVGPIEAHIHSAEKTTIRAVHVFPFGGFAKASEWLIDRGSWAEKARFPVANRA